MADVLNRLSDIAPEPQPADGVTYAHKIDKAEARIDFARTAEEVEQQVRAFNPVPGAYFEHQGERVKVLAARAIPGAYEAGVVLDEHLAIGCGAGGLSPTLVQRAGKGAMTADELLRGFPIPAGTRLG
jgi:methionyl-tRNA formyltransferase